MFTGHPSPVSGSDPGKRRRPDKDEKGEVSDRYFVKNTHIAFQLFNPSVLKKEIPKL